MFADKEPVDYSQKDKSFFMIEVMKKPWEWKRKLLARMELRLDAAIDRVNNLARDVDIKKMEKEVIDKTDMEDISREMRPIVAENMEYKFGSEAFDALHVNNNHENKDQIVDVILQKDTHKR